MRLFRRPRLLPGRPRLPSPTRITGRYRRRDRSRLPGTGIMAVLMMGGIGLAAIGGAGSGPAPVVQAAATDRFTMCGSGTRYTCVVDGDTIWWRGQNLRLQSYDTPEPYNDICGGQREVALAHRASARLLDLLNSNEFAVQTFGTDRFGRTLATVKIDGVDVGDILISEGLARRWPDGHEFWCD